MDCCWTTAGLVLVGFLLTCVLFKTFLKERLIAYLISKLSRGFNKLTGHHKRELFSSLDGLKGEILEVGIGTGANLPFYPAGVKIVGLDPNPFMNPKLQEAADKHPDVKIKRMIAGKAEDLRAVANDDAFEAVVATLTLCSVEDTNKCLAEIKRVLKPGGRFYFLEHTVDERSLWRRIIQYVLMPVWYPLFDCSMIQKTWENINAAGFSQVNYKKLYLYDHKIPFLRAHLIGYAEK